MKKIYLVLAALLLTLGTSAHRWDGIVATTYDGGNGTEANPYLIATPGQLAKIAADLNADSSATTGIYYRLTQDLMFNDSVYLNIVPSTNHNSKADYPGDTTRLATTPFIGNYNSDLSYLPFRGHFDGAGHTISGLYVWNQKLQCTGLFAVLEEASVKNLRITDSYYLTNANHGLLAGRAINSEIINCAVDSSYSEGGGSKGSLLIGSLVGNTTVFNCYAQGFTFGKNDMGGMFGRIGNGKENSVWVDNCYSMVTVYVKRRNNGSLAFDVATGANVDYCYWVPMGEATKAAWTGSDLLGPNVKKLSAEEMATDSIVSALNARAEKLNGACRWQKGPGHPVFDFSTITDGIVNATVNQPRRTGFTYNLAGQRVSGSYHGIVIRDGKKFFKSE